MLAIFTLFCYPTHVSHVRFVVANKQILGGRVAQVVRARH